MERQQKVYSDASGRTAKTEVLNWDSTVYATTVNTFNARDQVTMVRQYQGSDQSGVYQETAMGYDGYGRLTSKHVPEQNAGAATTYSYNPDDTVNSVIDARGASATYSYNNNRRLVNGITYSAPSSITPTSNASFGYDAVGNRTSMSDALGSQSYSYNQLSQLTSETRTFNAVGTFTLSYDYNLAGELKKITDATNMTINYGFDNTGRLNAITGSGDLVGGVSNYGSAFQYRAWGGLKQVSNGSGHTTSVSFDSRLRATNFSISDGVANQNHEYYNDGRLSFVHDTTNINFDRSFTFDHAGRLTVAAAGGEARHDTGPVPMYETFQYDAWDHTTSRFNESWLNDFYDSASYTNGRRADWTYDADGRVSTIDTRSYGYDAAGKTRSLTGQRWTPSGYVATSTACDFDGDGQKVQETSNASGSSITYYLRSSVLRGSIIEELNASGQKVFGYVYTPMGGLIARQVPGQNYVMLKQMSPTGGSQYEFFKSETVTGLDIRQEFDPEGANIRLNAGPVGHGGGAGDLPSGGGASDSRFGAIDNPAAGCMSLLDGVPTPCDWINRMAGAGALQLKVGNTKYDIQAFGDRTVWVDAWEGYFTPARGFTGYDSKGNEQYDAGTSGIRNVGYFITIQGAGGPVLGAIALPQNSERRLTSDEYLTLRNAMAKALQSEKCRNFIDALISYNTGMHYDSGKDFLAFSNATFNSTEGGVFFKNAAGGISRQHAGDYPKVFIGPGWRLDLNVQLDASTLMHELIHGLTHGADNQLSFDLQKLGIVPIGKDGKPLPPPTGTRNGEYYNDYSGYWDTALHNACF